MTFEEATAQLRRARDGAHDAADDAADAVGRVAEQRVRNMWPRDTGRSALAWHWDGDSLACPVTYASDVHQGLAFRLVPAVFRELEPVFAEQFERRLDAAAGGW